MAEPSKIKEFPDISNKLTAPTKKSLFERQKAEAEAKRQREEAETAAVYEDFVKSFEDNNDTLPSSSVAHRLGDGTFPGPGGPRGGGFGGAPKRHFAPTGPRGNSGPGSLGPAPSLSRKRAFDGSHPQTKDREHGLFAFENSSTGPVDAVTAFQTSDDEDDKVESNKAAERAAPKPTLHLTSLPPGTSPAVIKSLIPPVLTVDAVRILPPSAPGSTERRSMSAIVTLAKDTPASDIDTVVNSLQNRYLGLGFYLSLSRHLSSAALGSVGTVTGALSSTPSSMPFGAKPMFTGPGGSLSRAPPPNSLRGGFAPPASYSSTGPGQFGRGNGPIQVPVTPPSDIKQLKLIHKTLEALLTHGPEFEALLMSRPDVQRDEKWAWLWDPRSAGGVWYRWRLWEILTGSSDSKSGRRRLGDPTQKVFDGGAPWLGPEKGLQFEFTTGFDTFVSDPEYDSSDEDESGDEGQQRRHNQGGAPPDGNAGGQIIEKAYLNPLQKAKLTHLLARLPTTTAKLRKGDVARVTAFAISHAGSGAEEVVDVLVSNIEKPFAWSGANPDRKTAADDDTDRHHDPDDEAESKKPEKDDPSSSKLIALYLISDILSSSSTSGVRHAWRYRQLFESALTQRRVFERLGRLERELQWGRLRAEKWRRSVGGVLALWEGWCVFPQAAQERFAAAFANPPREEGERAVGEGAEGERSGAEKARSRWRTVDVTAKPGEAGVGFSPRIGAASRDGEEVEEDVDGEPLVEENLDGEPLDEDVDREPMEEDAEDVALQPKSEDPPDGATMRMGSSGDKEASSELSEAARARQRRPKAIDMFADSDGE